MEIEKNPELNENFLLEKLEHIGEFFLKVFVKLTLTDIHILLHNYILKMGACFTDLKMIPYLFVCSYCGLYIYIYKS